MDRLYYGDNLDVLREHVADESVDLVYLDPPFNSNATYDIMFAPPDGRGMSTGVTAFDDTWRWGPAAAAALAGLAENDPALHTLMQALRQVIGANAMMAYLAMMAVRLVELKRVLRRTGSLYLHCDPTASHYLKLVLDAIFGPEAFRREIIWRSGWVSGFKTRTRNWVRNHDTILYYLKDSASDWTFNKQFAPHAAGYARRGGGANPAGKAIDDVWDDPALYSPNIKSFSTEKLGYPTQKPVALLERIIAASSNPGDVVLDPFCGCGTALEAARRLGRRWIGIDSAHFAIGMADARLRAGRGEDAPMETIGVPADMASAMRLAQADPREFAVWLCLKLEGLPEAARSRAAGQGIVGRLCLRDRDAGGTTAAVAISLQSAPGLGEVHALLGAMERDGYAHGLLIATYPPSLATMAEAAAAGLRRSGDGAFPRVQIRTLADLFEGRAADLPPLEKPARRTGHGASGAGRGRETAAALA